MADEVLQARVGELEDNAKITVFACQIRALYDEIANQEFALDAIKKENAGLRKAPKPAARQAAAGDGKKEPEDDL